MPAGIFDHAVVEATDDREPFAEERIIAYGEVSHQVIAVVYTWRGQNRRIISARKATKAEREAYYRTIYPEREADRLGARGKAQRPADPESHPV
jgi:hypothetical protein